MPYEKDFYKELVDNLYDGVYFVDRDRRITYWNKGAERITGYSAPQVIGRRCRDTLLNHVTANDSPDSLIRRADSLMYRSKRTGGNLVMIG